MKTKKSFLLDKEYWDLLLEELTPPQKYIEEFNKKQFIEITEKRLKSSLFLLMAYKIVKLKERNNKLSEFLDTACQHLEIDFNDEKDVDMGGHYSHQALEAQEFRESLDKDFTSLK